MTRAMASKKKTKTKKADPNKCQDCGRQLTCMDGIHGVDATGSDSASHYCKDCFDVLLRLQNKQWKDEE